MADPKDQRSEYDQRMWPFPGELILGMARGEWPVMAFVSEVHALTWVKDDPIVRRLRRVSVSMISELTYVAPSSPRLETA